MDCGLNSILCQAMAVDLSVDRFVLNSKQWTIHDGLDIEGSMTAVNFKEDPFFTEAASCLPQDFLIEVQDQGKTKSCYAYVIANIIHADIKKNLGIKVRGSEQEFLDCLHLAFPPQDFKEIIPRPDKGYPNSIPNTLRYVKYKGLSLLKDYPWVGYCEECARDNILGKPVISIAKFCKARSVDKVIGLLSKQIAVTGIVNLVTEKLCQWEGTGIYTLSEEDKEEVDGKIKNNIKVEYHAITLIGYGETEAENYFIAQNSWSTYWGYNGYFRVNQDCVTAIFYVEKGRIENAQDGRKRGQIQQGASTPKKQKTT